MCLTQLSFYPTLLTFTLVSKLSSTSWLPLVVLSAGLCATLFFGCELMWKRRKETRRSQTSDSTGTTAGSTAVKAKLLMGCERASPSRRWRSNGWAGYWPIAFALACCVLLGSTAAGFIHNNESRLYRFNEATIVETIGDDGFILQPINAESVHVRVCHDYPLPPFRRGLVLRDIIFYDMSECWSLDPEKHAGYHFDVPKPTPKPPQPRPDDPIPPDRPPH